MSVRVTCEKCKRHVVPEHECDGDPTSTCAVFGCGRPPVDKVGTQDDTGRWTWLAVCKEHYR